MRKIKKTESNLVNKFISALNLDYIETASRQVFSGITSYASNLQGVRSGSRVSRFFRHVFEHKYTNRFLGSNLALMVLASSFVPSVGSIYASDYEQNVYESSSVLSTDVTIRQPLESIQINQGYHIFHPGIDYEGITGDPIYPVMSGVIDTIEYSYFAYGNSIIVNHYNGYTSRYAHLSKINVKKGDVVDTNTVIGLVGSTGRSSGDHLHLEIMNEGRNINPLSILPN